MKKGRKVCCDVDGQPMIGHPFGGTHANGCHFLAVHPNPSEPRNALPSQPRNLSQCPALENYLKKCISGHIGKHHPEFTRCGIHPLRGCKSGQQRIVQRSGSRLWPIPWCRYFSWQMKSNTRQSHRGVQHICKVAHLMMTSSRLRRYQWRSGWKRRKLMMG